jgi:putative salt-induced outer membrane protein YdiY
VEEIIEFAGIIFYQPLASDRRDYRISTEASFNIVITEKISLNSGLKLFYDSQPPFEIPKFNYRFENGLVYRF